MNKLPLVVLILIFVTLFGCAQQAQVQPFALQPQPAEVAPPPTNEVPVSATEMAATPSKIAFVRSGTSDWDIFTADSDGNDIVNITNSPSQDLWPSWSPDGTQIAFQSNRGALGRQSIYVMDANGANVFCLTSPTDTCQFPAWSPDGTKIAFSSSALAWGTLLDIFTMNTDGTSKSPILQVKRNPAKGTYSQVCPSWFSDSQRVAYASNGSGLWEIREVTSNNNVNINILGPDTSNSKNYPVRIDGRGLQFPPSGGDTIQPNTFPALSVSPDGKTIAFDYYNPATYRRDIYALDTDNNGIRCLTCEQTANCYFPTWSPDGSRIAFTLESDGKTDIWTVNSDGSNPTLLIKDGMFPSWQKGE